MKANWGEKNQIELDEFGSPNQNRIIYVQNKISKQIMILKHFKKNDWAAGRGVIFLGPLAFGGKGRSISGIILHWNLVKNNTSILLLIFWMFSICFSKTIQNKMFFKKINHLRRSDCCSNHQRDPYNLVGFSGGLLSNISVMSRVLESEHGTANGKFDFKYFCFLSNGYITKYTCTVNPF